MSNRVFFIVSAPRSGSTSLATICNDASNCKCLIEPHYDCRVLSRDLMDGKINREKIIQWVKENILPSAIKYLESGIEIYSEKDYVYGPLISSIYEILECKFVFIKRDGRDFVRSRINKHTQVDGSCYRECKEKFILTPKAKKVSEAWIKNGNAADYSRPRPIKSDSLYNKWQDLSLTEMCAFYWTRVNEFHLKELSLIPKNKWITVDYSSENLTGQVMDMVEFLGLKGLDRKKVQGRLDEKINSLGWRKLETGDFPHWTKWSDNEIKKFNAIAGNMMKELGYA